MPRILYLDCFSGISGDMTLAALVDAGADRRYIENELKKIKIEPFALEWKTVIKKGISSLKVDVVVPEGHHPHHHRHYADIVKLIKQAGFNEQVQAMSLTMFAKIGEAEGKIHNLPLDKVHFHEVGAIDSIVDIIGVALAIDSLQIDKIVCAPVPLGSGTVRCDHGFYPVPAPATLEMMIGLPIAPSDHSVELTTPTGAAIAAGLVKEFSAALPPMIVQKIGYGAGTRDLPNHPNVLRVIVGEVETGLPVWAQQEHIHSHHHHNHEHEHHHEHHHHEHSHHHGEAEDTDHDEHHHNHEHHHHEQSNDNVKRDASPKH